VVPAALAGATEGSVMASDVREAPAIIIPVIASVVSAQLPRAMISNVRKLRWYFIATLHSLNQIPTLRPL
jgi:hypothetical protein